MRGVAASLRTRSAGLPGSATRALYANGMAVPQCKAKKQLSFSLFTSALRHTSPSDYTLASARNALAQRAAHSLRPPQSLAIAQHQPLAQSHHVAAALSSLAQAPSSGGPRDVQIPRRGASLGRLEVCCRQSLGDGARAWSDQMSRIHPRQPRDAAEKVSRGPAPAPGAVSLDGGRDWRASTVSAQRERVV